MAITSDWLNSVRGAFNTNHNVADMRRKVEEIAVRWRMKDPDRAEDSTGYSSVPLMSSQGDDVDDQVLRACIVLSLCVCVSG